MKKFITLVAIMSFAGQALAISPTEVLISVYSVAVSSSVDCSNPIVVIDNGSTPKELDFTSTPSLGNASVSSGNYPCVILRMSDVIKFRPDTSSGSCVAGTQYTIDVCRTSQGTYTPMTLSGTSATYGSSTGCSGSDSTPVSDTVPLFLSTQSTNSGGGGGSAFDRPASAGTNGFNLNGAFIVSGSGSGTFVVNFSGKVDGGQSSCGLNPPIFGFR